MNILLDTNIVIPLEDTSRQLDPRLAEMRKLSEQNNFVLCMHPAQKKDILRDSNEERKRIVLSRLPQYNLITSPPSVSQKDLDEHGWKESNENDEIDNLLLQAVYRSAVHILVTEDKQIHSKARQAGIQENVHYLDQYLTFLRKFSNRDSRISIGVEDRFLYQLNIKQPFFDSLRDGYPKFDTWYNNAAAYHRKAWCISENDEVKALCIYKEENSPIINDDEYVLPGLVLKLCTFKVGENIRGNKIGERLLLNAFEHAVHRDCSYVYLHAYGKDHEMLISLCREYGFEQAGRYQDRDDVFIKQMKPPTSIGEMPPLEYAIRYYPSYQDSEKVNKFLVPIHPSYHNDLFAKTSEMALGLFSKDPNMYSSQSTTIKKAYICNANTKQIRRGDLLLFYRTDDRMSIETIGVVEQLYYGQDSNKVIPMVSKRTVFSRDEIEEILSKPTLVILFRYMASLTPVKTASLQEAGIKGPIQTIRQISHEQYFQCFKVWS